PGLLRGDLHDVPGEPPPAWQPEVRGVLATAVEPPPASSQWEVEATWNEMSAIGERRAYAARQQVGPFWTRRSMDVDRHQGDSELRKVSHERGQQSDRSDGS